jgi:hypothetical protein
MALFFAILSLAFGIGTVAFANPAGVPAFALMFAVK